MNRCKPTSTALLCPNEQSMYQLTQMDKEYDYIIALTTSLDYEIENDFVLSYSKDRQQSEKISLQSLSSLLKMQISIKLLYCSLSVSEYLAMLYYVSIGKDIPIQIHDFAKTSLLQQGDNSFTHYCATCNEIDEATYQNAVFTTLTQAQKETYYKLWQQFKHQNKLKCFNETNHKQIQLLEHNAFDEQIRQMVHEQKSFGECYQYFLNNYGLSEQWLISRFHTLKLSL